MNRIFRNLIPLDTRSVEFPCSLALLIFAVLTFFGIVYDKDLIILHPPEFWLAFTAVVGILQMVSLLDYPNHEPLRTVIAWVSGTFWFWLGMTHLDQASSAVAISIGVSNFVSFIINTVVLSEKWKQ